MKTRLPLLLAILAMLTSCTVTENLSITSPGGCSEAGITVAPFFLDVLYDFSEFLPEDSNQNLMDASMDGFVAELERKQAVVEPSYVKTGEYDYILTFSYESLSQFSSAYGIEGQTLLTETGNSFSFYLDINNYDELKSIVSFLRNPNFEVYGPDYNQGMSEEDYLDMIYFLLGEEGPEAISNGVITIAITVPGTVVSAESADITAPDTITTSFPLIDFLLLAEPIAFSVTWS